MSRRLGAWCTIAAAPMLAIALGRLAEATAPGVIDGGAQSADVWLSSLIGLAGALAGALASAYLSVAAAAMIAAHLRARLAVPMRGRGVGEAAIGLWVPATWRRVVAGALGVAVATGIALPAAADEGTPSACAPGLAGAGTEAACADVPTPLLPSVPGVTFPDVTAEAADSAQGMEPAAPATAPATASATAWPAEAITPLAPQAPTGVPAPQQPAAALAPQEQPAALSPQLPAAAGTSAEPPSPPEQYPPDALAPGGPALPAPSQAPAQSQAPASSQAPTSAYVVQPGDSLWTITEALLGEDASDAEIAQAWPSLYSANRDAIGANASLIFPGTVLAVPAGLAS